MNEPRDTTMNDMIGGIKMAKHEEVKNGVIFPVGERMKRMHNFLLDKVISKP